MGMQTHTKKNISFQTASGAETRSHGRTTLQSRRDAARAAQPPQYPQAFNANQHIRNISPLMLDTVDHSVKDSNAHNKPRHTCYRYFIADRKRSGEDQQNTCTQI